MFAISRIEAAISSAASVAAISFTKRVTSRIFVVSSLRSLTSSIAAVDGRAAAARGRSARAST